MNNLGQIVGWTFGSITSGFYYNRGKFGTISVPGSSDITEAWGVNDAGVVVGWYFGCTPSCSYHGFALRKGKYLAFDYPGAMDTFASGINSLGQIVGSYFENQSYHGFVTSPITAADFRSPDRADHH